MMPLRVINAAMCASGQLASNFLTQASWRLYEIRLLLCTTPNFLTNTTIETCQAGYLGRLLTITSGLHLDIT